MYFDKLFTTDLSQIEFSFKRPQRSVILFQFCSDVVVVNGLFGDEEDMSIYKNLLHETQSSGIDQGKIF